MFQMIRHSAHRGQFLVRLNFFYMFQKLLSVLCAVLCTPVLIFSQDFDYPISFFDGLYKIVTTILPILVAFAFLVFVWGLVVFISHSGDDKVREEGKNRIVWGVVALFVITAIWGILALLQKMVGIDETNSATLTDPAPKVPTFK